MKTRKISLIIFLFFYVQLYYISAQSYDSLNINNINARINADASLFWDLIESPKFEVPKGNGTHSIFAASLWVGGKDSNDSLHLAATTYNSNGKDFWPGPVMDSINYSPAQDSLWNKVWKINKSDIEYYISHWNQPGYIIPQNFVDWPAHGNISLGQNFYLAPFFDDNSDGVYNPFDGDHPLIKGDQAIFFILNDDRNIHAGSGGKKIKTEIQVMAYEYNCHDSALWNTLFLNYKIINRSTNIYDSTYFGLFVDSDIGGFLDDFSGCDVQRGSFYFYNGDFEDEGAGNTKGYGSFVPAQSVTFLAGPYQDEDNSDNPLVYDFAFAFSGGGIPYAGLGSGYGDNIFDNERMGLNSFNYHNNNLSNTGQPVNDKQFYNYMGGYWKNGTPMTYGGNGSGGTIQARYMFPGTTDPLGWGTGGLPQQTWTEITSGNSPNDRRGVGSSGPSTFKPGDVQELDFAFVFGRDYNDSNSNQAGVVVMQQRIDAIRGMFANDTTPCGGFFSTAPEIKKDQIFTVFPNPASGKFTLSAQSGNISSAEVYNFLGQNVFAINSFKAEHFSLPLGGSAWDIDLSSHPNGIYIIKIQSGKNIFTKKLVKQ